MRDESIRISASRFAIWKTAAEVRDEPLPPRVIDFAIARAATPWNLGVQGSAAATESVRFGIARPLLYLFGN